MRRFILVALLLSACQSGSDDGAPSLKETPAASETQGIAKDDVVKVRVVKEGVVRLRLNAPVSEPLACIIPISVENGLADPTRVVMIGFDLMGPGDDAKGNMFAPAADPGEISEARVIVEGQSCAAYDTINIPEMRCTSGGETCEDKIELIDGGGLRFVQTG